MRLLTPLCLFFGCALMVSVAGCQPDATSPVAEVVPDSVDFNFHVKPILSDRCFKCHGPDEQSREAGLRLDTPAGAFAALEGDATRFAIVPGDPELSEVIARINHPDPEERMPHPDSKLFLSDTEKQIIERWIAQGAEWKTHWSFIPPEKAALPAVVNADWPQHPLDHFVLARLERDGLSPAPEESREKWLRRVSLDLTGLPPTLEGLDAFLADNTPEAYEKVVDALLASPAYGERMATVWLDAARYADSHGYQDDRPRTMWPWRDWVIEAFNSNLPYDQFLTWQLAGDLLPDATYEQKLATGFNRNHGITQEGGVVNEEYVTEYVADRTNTMATAMLGLTVECARCHDHKYDPISQNEYFQMFSFFNGIDERGQINYFDLAPKPHMLMEDVQLEEEIEALAQETADATTTYDALRAVPPDNAFQTWLDTEWPTFDLGREVAVGLVSHYPFDTLVAGETPDNVTAARMGKINTRLLNVLADPELTNGRLGQSIQFDGENYINLGDVGDFDHADRFSLGAWIQYPAPFEKEATVLVKRNEEQKRGGYQLSLTSAGTLKASLIHNQGGERIEVVSTAIVPMQAWAHVFLTYDGSGQAKGVNLFVDGVLAPVTVLQDSLARRSMLNGNDLLAGNWTTRNTPHGGLQGFANGLIDDVRVYNRTLSDLEVQVLAGRDVRAQLASQTGSANQGDAARLLYAFYTAQQPAIVAARQRLDSLRAIHLELPYVMVMEEMASPRATHVLARGAYDAKEEEVAAGTPKAVLAFSSDLPPNRLGLAQWITDDANPLTARVAVNRFWMLLFGRGVVATPEDFGSQGALPSHPAMLDWLAVDFRENGWDTRRLMKHMVLSATYRQAARITEEGYQSDPDNVLLARGPAQRFSAEMIRDNALHVSGLLEEKVGGHWVKPYQPPGVWKELANQIGENKYRPSKGVDLYRRSLYSYWKRTIPPPAMLTFDAAERTVCIVKRQTTSTPLQSLVLLNDPQIIEASRQLAEQAMLAEADADLQLQRVFRLITSRLPDRTEKRLMRSLYQEENNRFTTDEESAAALLSVGESPINHELDQAALAALTIVANTLLNMDEAKMRS
ncbi:MAG: DUF1553 domain-containing protein [Bacteroidota bacterium]